MGFGKKVLKTSPVGHAVVKSQERRNSPQAQEEPLTDGESAVDLEEDGPEESDGKLHRKARKALDQNLAPGEEVRVILNLGPRRTRASIIATDRRLFIFKTGVASGATFGAKFTSFDYRNISGVSFHTGVLTGSAVVDVAGATPVGSSYWGQKNNDPWKAQNAIPIVRPWDNAKVQIAQIRQLISDCHDRAATPAPAVISPTSDDVVDQIKRLGELRDSGLITAQEFDAKKSELLGRL
jgi:hypothetical protein